MSLLPQPILRLLRRHEGESGAKAERPAWRGWGAAAGRAVNEATRAAWSFDKTARLAPEVAVFRRAGTAMAGPLSWRFSSSFIRMCRRGGLPAYSCEF